jgi:hypothetical protein
MKPNPQKKWGEKTTNVLREPWDIFKNHSLGASQKPPHGSNQNTLVDVESPQGEKKCSKWEVL